MPLTIIDLYGEDATKEKIFEVINAHHPEIAIMAGHGNATTYTAQEEQIVLKACENDEVMSGTVSHFVSCSVAQELLPSIINKGGVGTIGYQSDFVFIVNTLYTVEEDPYAEPFKDLTITIITKMLGEYSLKEVWQAGIDKCNEWIARLWNRPETDWAEVIACLEQNRDSLIALGNKDARVLGGAALFVRPDWSDLAMRYASYWCGSAIGVISVPSLSLGQLLGLGLIFMFLMGR